MNDTQAARQAILKRLKESAPRPFTRSHQEPKLTEDSTIGIETLVKEFSDHAVFAGAIVRKIPDLKKAAAAVVSFMKKLGFSSAFLSSERIVKASDIGVALVAAGLRVSVQGKDASAHRELSFASDVGITGALCGIAETGTVALSLGGGYSRLISHAPFAHVVLLPVRDIITDTHQFWSRMTDQGLYTERQAADFGKPKTNTKGRSQLSPRPPAVVLVTGPSMTADIALTAIRGIHGPGKMLILLLYQ